MTGTTIDHRALTSAATQRSAPRSAVRRVGGAVLDLFSNVRFGIVLLIVLFIYSSIGSAGIVYPIHPNIFSTDAWVHAQLRQFRPFELTEFEWFNWWPFTLLIVLICVTMTVTTLRRIRLNVINLGVWMIHTGIIVLCVGSVIYFAGKLEGDVAIVRRQLVAEIDGPKGPIRAVVAAVPGARTVLDGPDGRYELEVASIDPAWEIRTGDDLGRRAYSVSVMVTGPQQGGGERFIRQVLDGFPQYTEDMLFTTDPAQPMQRAVKALGKPIVDDALRLALDYQPSEHFYLRNDITKAWALYLRRPGDREWIERPILGLPLYNDSIASRDDVFTAQGDVAPPVAPPNVAVPAVDPRDPASDVTFHVTSYLRYAMLRSQLLPGGPGDPLNPAVWITVSLNDERQRDYRLLAFDSAQRRADDGLIAFRWVQSAEELAALLDQPTLEFEIPASGVTVRRTISDLAAANPNAEFEAIEGTPYSFRVRTIEDAIPLGSGTAALAIIELKGPKGEFRRWVFDDSRLTRDVAEDESPDAHSASTLIDDGIVVRYMPGAGRAVLTVVAGPTDEELGVIFAASNRPPRHISLERGKPADLGNGLTVTLTDFFPRAVAQSKPYVVPREQRMRDAGEFFSQIKLEVEGGGSPGSARFSGGIPWLTFHRYAFESAGQTLRRHIYAPSLVTLADGRQFELMFSRQRLPLPRPMALESFELATHLGGFTGESLTIRNYTSRVRFLEDKAIDAGAGGTAGTSALPWGPPLELSVNDPIQLDGWWFFQAQWDPPDEARGGQPASAGLNYTVLGVGNRRGVYTQLIGCCIAVAGMIYAFYVKPFIKRRRQLAVEAMVASMAARGEIPPGAKLRISAPSQESAAKESSS